MRRAPVALLAVLLFAWPVIADEPLAPKKSAMGPIRSALTKLRTKDYAALEKDLEKLASAGRRPGDFAHEFDRVTEAMSSLVELLPDLDAWVAARPESWTARHVRGTFLIDHAWRARGSGWANTVTDEGWRLFHDRLLAAKTDLEKSRALAPDRPYAASYLVTVAMGLSEDDSATARAFEQSLEADPLYVGAYQRRLTYLLPKWHGSLEATFAFVEKARKDHPDNPEFGLLEVAAHLEIARFGVRDGKAYLERDEVKKRLDAILDAVEEKYPRSPVPFRRRLDILSVRQQPHPIDLLEKAAEKGDVGAIVSVYEAYNRRSEPGDAERVGQWCRRAAELEHARSLARLGRMAWRGACGLAKDPDAAIASFRAASELGEPDGDLAEAEAIFEGGPGRPADPKKAMPLIERAARRGHTYGQFCWGQLLLAGEHVAKDEATGWKWIELAASHGLPEARKLIESRAAPAPR